MTNRLFVYGTLRKDIPNSMFHLLAREGEFVGRARVQGRLYQLGEFPGLVPGHDDGSWVQGEVYALTDPPRGLARLDAYEGCGPKDPEPHTFKRVEQEVVLETGRAESAWLYVYQGPTAGKTEIASGDYLDEAH